MTGDPTARATRMPSARCSSAVPRFGLNAFEVGQMLHVPTWIWSRRSAAYSRKAFSGTSSSESNASRSVMKSESSASDAA
jgi:hypothetical protein